MQFSEKQNLYRWIIILASFIIVILILWNTYTFFNIFKNEERLKMKILAESTKTLIKSDPIEDDVEIPMLVISSNETIPVILTENGNIVRSANIDDNIVNNKSKLKDFFDDLKKQNDPFVIRIGPNQIQYLYYGNSSLLNKLKYYPIALLFIIFLFGAVVYNYYRSTKMATQNKLWAGMAKETAHQIGTPLSSLIGWLEIMKADNVAEETIKEIEKDILRLQSITDRFSKIGSEPVLQPLNIIEETERSYDYLKSRFSKQVSFTFEAPKEPIMVSLNSALHSWTIENMVKNAIDAMKGKGTLAIMIKSENGVVKILVSDTGSGIHKKQFKRIFEPGFTTKKRGWGLGLSLTMRIVEEYHNGKIKVLHSEIGKGTTMQVSFKKN